MPNLFLSLVLLRASFFFWNTNPPQALALTQKKRQLPLTNLTKKAWQQPSPLGQNTRAQEGRQASIPERSAWQGPTCMLKAVCQWTEIGIGLENQNLAHEMKTAQMGHLCLSQTSFPAKSKNYLSLWTVIMDGE